MWVDKSNEFYKKSLKQWLQGNDVEMYSTHNKRKIIVTGRFMISISKHVYIDKLDNMVNKCKNTYHSTIKMKSVDVNSSTYTDFNKENKKEDLKFEVSDYVRISKYKNIFVKGYIPNWHEEGFVIKKVKNNVL